MQSRKIIPLILLFSLFSSPLLAEQNPRQHNSAVSEDENSPADEGIRFSCIAGQLGSIESGMDSYLASLGVSQDMFVKRTDQPNGVLVYTLNTPEDDSSTLDLAERPALKIRDDIVSIPTKSRKDKRIPVVSKKEIVLALLQHGRLTEFKGSACAVEALEDHVGIRQNTAAWAENLNWVWPDGDEAQWNKAYWNRGTPQPGVPLHEALNDVFLNPESYSFGCYTAAKMVIVQGMLDYYRRIKQDTAKLQQLEKRLYADHDPLVDIEPGAMWSFEKDFNLLDLARPGKLLTVARSITPKNFVPGDWVYFLNTDPVSYQKTGYEGSNPIYLGRNQFSDYFNDHNHAYTYEQKKDQVYQWRNGVFSFSRDQARRIPLTAEEMERLDKAPAEGGIMMDFRAYPYFFGYE